MKLDFSEYLNAGLALGRVGSVVANTAMKVIAALPGASQPMKQKKSP